MTDQPWKMDSDNGIPIPPDHLHPIAVERWNDYWRDADHETVKPSVHRDMVTAYCVSYAIWCQASESVSKLGLMVRANNKTNVHPLLGALERATNNMERLARKIGLEPGIAIKRNTTWNEWCQAELTALADSFDGVKEVIVDDDSGEGNSNAGTTGSNCPLILQRLTSQPADAQELPARSTLGRTHSSVH